MGVRRIRPPVGYEVLSLFYCAGGRHAAWVAAAWRWGGYLHRVVGLGGGFWAFCRPLPRPAPPAAVRRADAWAC